jgi:hypothetical protein
MLKWFAKDGWELTPVIQSTHEKAIENIIDWGQIRQTASETSSQLEKSRVDARDCNSSREVFIVFVVVGTSCKDSKFLDAYSRKEKKMWYICTKVCYTGIK